MKNAVEIVQILVPKGPKWLTLCPQAKNGRGKRKNISTLIGLLIIRFEWQMVKEVIFLCVEDLFPLLTELKTVKKWLPNCPQGSYVLLLWDSK